MKLFILIFLSFYFPYLVAHGQSAPDLGQLSSKERRKIKKQIKVLAYEVKLSSFICLRPNDRPAEEIEIAGLVFEEYDLITNHSGSTSGDIAKYLQYDGIHSYLDLPFPSKHAIDVNHLPPWLPAVFGVDYLIDLKQDNSNSLFYGIDSVGVHTYSTAYSSWDSLLNAVINHDLLFYPQSYESFSQKISEIKLSKMNKEAIDNKYRNNILAKIGSEPFVKFNKPSREVREWIWQSTMESIDISSTDHLAPIRRLDSLTICSFSFTPHDFETFTNELEYYAEIPVYNLADERETLKRLAAYDLVIVPISNLSSDANDFLEKIAKATNLLIIDFDSHSINDKSKINRAIVKVPDNNSLSQSLAAQVLFDGWAADSCSGRLRHGESKLANMNSDVLGLIDSIIADAIKEEAIPGCQILVAKNGMVVFDKSYGYQTYDSLKKINGKTLYDLASITKVLATTQGIMKLVEDSAISLDTPLSSYLPYLESTNKKDISIRQIMAHQAGLYPYYPFWKKVKEEAKLNSYLSRREVQVGNSLWVSKSVGDSILQWVAKSDLLADRIDTITHEQYFYSDIGFYLLKDLIEKKTHQPLDQYLSRILYKPLGTSLVFNPLCNYPLENIAPTEDDSELRNEVVQGYVHDRNAALLGGVSGQAGLFGSANDVATILQMQLNGGCYGGQQYFKSETIKQFISRPYVNNRRGLGWDMPGTEPDGPVSELASQDTYGHSGFTGGSIWVDPKESLIFVFLSNRVYPSVRNTKLIDLNIRTRIQDIVYRSIIK